MSVNSTLRLAAALLPAALVTACVPAQAAATDVVVQWGDAVATGAQAVSTVLIPLAVTAAGAAAARMAGPLRFLVTTTLVERLVRNASDYALNAVAGAVRGKTLSIPLGSAVIVAPAIILVISPFFLVQWAISLLLEAVRARASHQLIRIFCHTPCSDGSLKGIDHRSEASSFGLKQGTMSEAGAKQTGWQILCASLVLVYD